MWSTEFTIDTTTPPSAVWRLLADVDSWPRWNGAVGQVELDGPFAAGTTGRLTPPAQESLPFRLVEVDPERGYVSETAIADTVTLRAENSITAVGDGGSRIRLRVRLTGPAADYFGESFGPAIAAGLPATGAALAAQAAAAPSQAIGTP
jgi:uncharacterized protein YndB with AHSA1/START domain